MTTTTAKIFRIGRDQAIRIPVELSFETDTVTIEKKGDALIIRPRYSGGWDSFFADPSMRLPEDFDTAEDLPPPPRDCW
jgi:antitoxin VapB